MGEHLQIPCPSQGEGPLGRALLLSIPAPICITLLADGAEKINEGEQGRWGCGTVPSSSPRQAPRTKTLPELRVKVGFPVDSRPSSLPFPSRALCPL